MRVIGLHQKQHAIASQLTRFQNESKDSSDLRACVIILPAYAGTRLATQTTFLVLSYFQTSQKTRYVDLLWRVDRF